MKNVNSFRFIRAALEYEIERQIESDRRAAAAWCRRRGSWNAAEGRTYSMRSKEQAHDYRYFPEPDLPPLVVTRSWQAGDPEGDAGAAGGAPRAHDRGVRDQRAGCARR